ncbi:hypothetical protein M6D93_06925 [Jatrophihabitans telluris]|uniref:Uncharacterized protein n=1 Tax=Jatrophihabitans telluris TaxID=2038343 RepID=A0ABY4R2T7_9ACTN|nr:hypothetical protein [Jatrophihabitans telluris]UQX89728.1 hypothetical protein M6D93_06925 [Jatrophihabitans telluris]
MSTNLNLIAVAGIPAAFSAVPAYVTAPAYMTVPAYVAVPASVDVSASADVAASEALVAKQADHRDRSASTGMTEGTFGQARPPREIPL